jgi:hypothetical protein
MPGGSGPGGSAGPDGDDRQPGCGHRTIACRTSASYEPNQQSKPSTDAPATLADQRACPCHASPSRTLQLFGTPEALQADSARQALPSSLQLSLYRSQMGQKANRSAEGDATQITTRGRSGTRFCARKISTTSSSSLLRNRTVDLLLTMNPRQVPSPQADGADLAQHEPTRALTSLRLPSRARFRHSI